MPFSMVLGCDDCGTRWRHLAMKKGEALPGCPNPSCAGKAKQELAAPRIGRGAEAQTSWAVPETRAKREEMAYKIAEEQGATNIRTGQRQGDIASVAASHVEVVAPNGRSMKVTPKFENVSQKPEEIASQISALTGGIGAAGHRTNLNILGKITGR